jgi:2-oxoglutarate dehydrogenase E2 component (dihydrolipoamide succinyltransferase)
VQIGQVVAVTRPPETTQGRGEGDGVRAGARPEAEPQAAPADEKPATRSPQHDPRSRATPHRRAGRPAARRLAAEHGVDISKVEGTGKGRRPTKFDVQQAAERANAQRTTPATQARPRKKGRSPRRRRIEAPKPPKEAAPTAKPSIPPRHEPRRPPHGPDSRPQARRAHDPRKMTPLRRRVAERLVQAQQQAAILTTFNECDMSAVMGLRKQHQDAFVKQHGIKLGFMSFFVKACVHALQAVPAVNAQIEGDDIIENHYYDIGVAVSTPRGLMVPVVREADRKNFAEIEKDIAAYGQKAKDGKITIDDLSGGVFTISNGGIFGSMLSTPILNPPQSASWHAQHRRAPRRPRRPGRHRPHDVPRPQLRPPPRRRREAVSFLIKVKEAIEDPNRLLFGI